MRAVIVAAFFWPKRKRKTARSRPIVRSLTRLSTINAQHDANYQARHKRKKLAFKFAVDSRWFAYFARRVDVSQICSCLIFFGPLCSSCCTPTSVFSHLVCTLRPPICTKKRLSGQRAPAIATLRVEWRVASERSGARCVNRREHRLINFLRVCCAPRVVAASARRLFVG